MAPAAQTAFAAAVAGAYAAPYALRARTLRGRGTPVGPWRGAALAAALALLAATLAPGLDSAAGDRLSAHMAEHLVIGDLAPLLVVLACTGPVLAPVLRVPAVRALRPLTH